MTLDEVYQSMIASPEKQFDPSFRIEDAVELAQVLDIIPPHSVGVEIGSHNGASAVFMVKYKPNLWLFSIDKEIRQRFLLNISDINIGSIIGESSPVGSRWEIPLDLLWIDGDHAFESIKADLISWTGHLKAGGVVCGHDYDKGEFGVKSCVDDYFGKGWKKIVTNHIFAFQKL